MAEEKRFLVDVGMRDLPFPIKVASRINPKGQATIANISISARIMHEFEARWIDKFTQILHSHRDNISTSMLQKNIWDYYKLLEAKTILVNFEYPFFIEKTTPISKEKCLVRYRCKYTCKVPSVEDKAKILFKIEVPAITTYPESERDKPGGLFGQLSLVNIETEPTKIIYPEDLVEIVDRHAVAPVYSFLTEEDQNFIIKKIHTEEKHSVIMVDEIKEELSRNRELEWYSVKCTNFGMLHTYKTLIDTEKSWWLPFSGYDEEI